MAQPVQTMTFTELELQASVHQRCGGLPGLEARTLISPDRIMPAGLVAGLTVGLAFATGFGAAFFGGTASVDSWPAGNFFVGFGLGLRFAGFGFAAALTGFFAALAACVGGLWACSTGRMDWTQLAGLRLPRKSRCASHDALNCAQAGPLLIGAARHSPFCSECVSVASLQPGNASWNPHRSCLARRAPFSWASFSSCRLSPLPTPSLPDCWFPAACVPVPSHLQGSAVHSVLHLSCLR